MRLELRVPRADPAVAAARQLAPGAPERSSASVLLGYLSGFSAFILGVTPLIVLATGTSNEGIFKLSASAAGCG